MISRAFDLRARQVYSSIVLNASPQNGQRVLPDPDICHTRRVKFSHLSECLASASVQCPYAVPAGRGFFCSHPDRCQFEKAANGRFVWDVAA